MSLIFERKQDSDDPSGELVVATAYEIHFDESEFALLKYQMAGADVEHVEYLELTLGQYIAAKKEATRQKSNEVVLASNKPEKSINSDKPTLDYLLKVELFGEKHSIIFGNTIMSRMWNDPELWSEPFYTMRIKNLAAPSLIEAYVGRFALIGGIDIGELFRRHDHALDDNGIIDLRDCPVLALSDPSGKYYLDFSKNEATPILRPRTSQGQFGL